MSSVLSPSPASSPVTGRPASVAGEVRVAAAVLAGGLLVGALWALLAPPLARSADLGEERVAVDGLLALLSIGAGLLTAVLLVLAPGPRPPLRLGVVLASAVVANLLAAGVGSWLGHLTVRATGVALLWPLTTALLVALRTLGSLILHPDEDAPRRSRRHASAAPPEPPGVSAPREP